MSTLDESSFNKGKTCILFYTVLAQFQTTCIPVKGSRGGRADTRLASQAEYTGSMPVAGSHIIYLLIVYIYRIHYRPTDGDVQWCDPVYRSCTPGT